MFAIQVIATNETTISSLAVASGCQFLACSQSSPVAPGLASVFSGTDYKFILQRQPSKLWRSWELTCFICSSTSIGNAGILEPDREGLDN